MYSRVTNIVSLADVTTVPVYSAIKTVIDAHSDVKTTNKTSKKSGFQSLVSFTTHVFTTYLLTAVYTHTDYSLSNMCHVFKQ